MYTTQQMIFDRTQALKEYKFKVWQSIVGDLKDKPGIAIEWDRLKAINDSKYPVPIYFDGIVSYKGIELEIEMVLNPPKIILKFPSLAVVRKNYWKNGSGYTSYMRMRASTDTNTNDLYEKLESTYKRYMTRIAKKKETKINELIKNI